MVLRRRRSPFERRNSVAVAPQKQVGRTLARCLLQQARHDGRPSRAVNHQGPYRLGPIFRKSGHQPCCQTRGLGSRSARRAKRNEWVSVGVRPGRQKRKRIRIVRIRPRRRDDSIARLHDDIRLERGTALVPQARRSRIGADVAGVGVGREPLEFRLMDIDEIGVSTDRNGIPCLCGVLDFECVRIR